MIKVSILYPNHPESWFDRAYYTGTHMPQSRQLLSAHPGFRGLAVDVGLYGVPLEAPPPFVAMAHFLFTSAEDFMAAFTPHAATLQGDIPNYTNITPVIQFSTVAMS